MAQFQHIDVAAAKVTPMLAEELLYEGGQVAHIAAYYAHLRAKRIDRDRVRAAQLQRDLARIDAAMPRHTNPAEIFARLRAAGQPVFVGTLES